MRPLFPPRVARAFRLAVRRPSWTARDVDDEILFHLQSRVEHLMARGWSRRDAEAEARRRFGPSWPDAVRSIHRSGQAREERLAMWERLGSLIHDVRLSLRSLGRSPGFTATVLLTLGLCIAASVTIFTVIDAVLVRALPYPDASQLHVVYERSAEGGGRLASYPTFRDWREQSRAFSGMAFVRGGGGILDGADGPDRISVALATPGFFKVLGAPAALGRTFRPDEEHGGTGNVVVLSHALWMRRFGGDPGVVGRSVRLDSAPVTIVGVMPAGVSFPDWADAWQPIAPRLAVDPVYTRRNAHSDSRVIVRLRAGVDSAHAAADLAAIERRIATTEPDGAASWTAVDLRPLRDEVIGAIRPTLLMLGAAVLFVLLIACVNVANLAAVRATARARELAIRAALGASRGRVVRQLVTESVLLAAAAGLLGVALTALFVRALRAAAPAGLPRVAELAVDWRVLALGVAFTLLAALACAAVPTLRALGLDANEALRAGRQGSGGGRAANRARGAFTVAQFALALMLLAGAGLLLRSFERLLQVQLGFEPEHVATLRVAPPERYATPDAMVELDRRMMAAVARVPGVTAVAVVNHVPLTGAYIPTRVLIPGRVEDPAGNDVALYKTVSEGYQRVMGIRLLAGRWFGANDMTSAGTGVVVSDVVAARYWPRQDPIGRPLTIFRSSQGRPDVGQPMPSVVIGVVAGARHLGPSDDPMPEVFVPYTREVWPWINLAVRTSGDPARTLPALRRAVHAVDPSIPLDGSAQMSGFQPLARYMSVMMEPRRYLTTLLVAFALAALLLAAIGVYGVTSYGVAQRTSEIGVRMALGASPTRIVMHVVRQGALFAAAGVAIGLIGAVALGRLIGSLLFATSPLDPVTLATVTLLLMAIAVVACLLPARRGARIEPSVAMRTD